MSLHLVGMSQMQKQRPQKVFMSKSWLTLKGLSYEMDLAFDDMHGQF